VVGAGAAWLGLLATGLSGMLRQTKDSPIARVLLAVLTIQLALGAVYGNEEMFLFSLHWLPLLVLVAAYGTLSRLRPYVLGMALVVGVVAAANNVSQFNRAVQLAQGVISTR
jgi:hypothetical protein